MQQYADIYLLLNYSRLKKPTPQIVGSVPEAATTDLRTPDDRRDRRMKHIVI